MIPVQCRRCLRPHNLRLDILTSHLLQHSIYKQPPSPLFLIHSITAQARNASSASSSRWTARQGRDAFTRASKVAALKSRAVFKLLEIDKKHQLFRPGQTVVDLGYAPGSWSQVAISRVNPENAKRNVKSGRVLGIDLIPAQPPRGVSTIQGDFLNEEIQEMVRSFVRDDAAGRVKRREVVVQRDGVESDEELDGIEEEAIAGGEEEAIAGGSDTELGRVVDIVLSDMNEPWPLANAWLNSVVNPYRRMMNTSGNSFRDHVGSMDLCLAALTFAFDTLKTGGHFLCKFYQGAEDKAFEQHLKVMFEKVYRIKPESSRKESREAYFLGMKRKAAPTREEVFSGT